MNKRLVIVVASVVGLLSVSALVWTGTIVAQRPSESGSGGAGLSSANIPAGVAVSSSPDLPAQSRIEDIESAQQTYTASLRIVGSALKPRDSDVQWASSGGGGCVYASSGNQNTVFNTPLYLPQGATVKQLRMYFNDTLTSSNSIVWFTVYDLYGNIVYEWSVSSSGSAGLGYTTTSEFTHTVDYNSYSYVVNWRPYALGSGMQLCGLRLYYHTPPGYTYIPLVTRAH
jgi:hypothetical protein